MKVIFQNKINLKTTLSKLESDDLWLFAAHEWHRLYSKYVPHDTGQLRDNVSIKPKEITHNAPYSRFIYYGVQMVDPQYGVGGFTNDGGISWFSRPGVKKIMSGKSLNLKNGSKEWDKAARRDKKDKTLATTMQGWIEKNI